MSHARHIAPKRSMFGEGEYMGHYFGHPHDPRNADDSTECPVCDGDGFRFVLDDNGRKEREVCPACDGARYLDENGFPVKEQENY